MKIATSLLILLLFATYISAQKKKDVSVAFVNARTATPFSQSVKLITSIQHPGIEIGYSFNWKTKNKHDWYQEIKLAYFYHRFVQHAIPFYTNFGYRYKFSNAWTAQAAVGAGYLHSIPATAQLQLQSTGEYKSSKGIGRMQGLAVLNFGGSHIIRLQGTRSLKIFVTYQQMIQTPFINAYVPLLPYNSLLLGMRIPVK
ncbi:MAG TPA: hypothetical protein VMY77_05650 [Chitinophagaceae bacterium]|nr:hypothetical protein [Chitinophagaceae bacterium]